MSEEEPDPSPAPRFTVAGMPPGGSVMNDKLRAIGEGIGTRGTSTIMQSIGADYAAIANQPIVNLTKRLSAAGGPLDFSRYTKTASDTAATAAALAPARAWEHVEIPDYTTDLDRFDFHVEPPASEAAIRELLEVTVAESERNLARAEASEAARLQERQHAEADKAAAELARQESEAANERRHTFTKRVALLSVIVAIASFVFNVLWNVLAG